MSLSRQQSHLRLAQAVPPPDVLQTPVVALDGPAKPGKKLRNTLHRQTLPPAAAGKLVLNRTDYTCSGEFVKPRSIFLHPVHNFPP